MILVARQENGKLHLASLIILAGHNSIDVDEKPLNSNQQASAPSSCIHLVFIESIPILRGVANLGPQNPKPYPPKFCNPNVLKQAPPIHRAMDTTIHKAQLCQPS